MAGNYDELKAVLTELLTNRFAPKPTFTRGLLGDGLGNVTVPGRPDKNYVRFNRGSTEFFEIFNVTVNAVNDWPVLIGELPWLPGLTQVVGTDWAAYEQSGWRDNVGATSPHAPTHEWPDGSPGSDSINVYMRSIIPLRAYTLGTGSTTIYANSYEYENLNGTGTVWGGLPGIELAPVMSALSTGTARLMGIYLDPSVNTLGIITGAIDIFTDASDPPSPQFPRGILPVARIRVYGGQASIGEIDIRDARQPFSFISTTITRAWPAPGEIIIGTTVYDTLADAVSVAASGDVIIIGPGEYTVDGLSITTDIRIVGSGRDNSFISGTILKTTTSSSVLTVTGVKVVLEDMAISAVVGSGNISGMVITDAASPGEVEARNVVFRGHATGGGTEGRGVLIDNGQLIAFNCKFTSIVGPTQIGLKIDSTGANIAELTACELQGGDYDLDVDGGTVILNEVRFASDTMNVDTGVTISGTALDSNGVLAGHIVTNSSLAVANKYDVGYLDEAGEYLTTTAVQDTVSWHIVTIGGSADTGFIFAKNTGPATVNYTGSAPNAGDFLVTSTTAGSAQQQVTMRPEIFAVCTAAGDGGTVEVLLLTQRTFVSYSSTNNVFRIDSHSDTSFAALINGAPTTTNVPYDTVTGNEDSIVPTEATQLGKIVLHNTDDATDRNITAVNTGTNDITTVTITDGWATNEAIQANSQVCLSGGAPFFFDIDLSGQTEIPVMATAIALQMFHQDTGGLSFAVVHPFETFSSAKQVTNFNYSTSVGSFRYITVPLISQKFCVRAEGAGSGTAITRLVVNGYWLATP